MVVVGHRPVFYDDPRTGPLVGPSVEVVAGADGAVVERVGWAVVDATDDAVAWYEPDGYPAPAFPRVLEPHGAARWMTTTEPLERLLRSVAPAATLRTTPLVPVAIVDGDLRRARGPILVDTPAGPPSDRPVPAASPGGPWSNLRAAERSRSSQNGEDGVIEALFATIGTTNRVLVEFGCGDAVQCNSAHLLAQGWNGLLMDPFAENRNPEVEVHHEFVTAENIQALLDGYGVPEELDLLSIDIDGNDLWVWQRIRSRPRVVVVEYNATISPLLSRTIAYDPAFRWDSTDHFGASLLALAEAGRAMGYTLVHCESRGVNAFFVADECLPADHRVASVVDLYVAHDLLGHGLTFPSHPTATMVDPFAPRD